MRTTTLRLMSLGLALTALAGCAQTAPNEGYEACTRYAVEGDRVYVRRCGAPMESLTCMPVGGETYIPYAGYFDTVRCS